MIAVVLCLMGSEVICIYFSEISMLVAVMVCSSVVLDLKRPLLSDTEGDDMCG